MFDAACSSLHASRVQRAEAFVKQRVASHDSSHDWFHIDRVRKMSAALAREEQLPAGECQLAELAALVHEVADHKYSTDPEADRHSLQAFLAADLALSPQEQELAMYVVDSLGFKEELGRQQQARQQQDGSCNSAGAGEAAAVDGAGSCEQLEAARQRVLGVVQDADRLDAIGAIGIARCLTFGGRFNRVLHDPAVPPRSQLTREQYADRAAAQQQTTLNHFHEKLLKLKDLMRTAAGRRVAEARHAYMLAFLQQFQLEWDAAA